MVDPNINFENPLLAILLDTSKKEDCCFVETHTNETVPIKDCYIEETETGLYVKGTDYINNQPYSFLASNIKIVTSTIPTSIFMKSQRDNFIRIAELCEVENIIPNSALLYKNVPLYQKLISLFINKEYQDITIEEIKLLWKFYIEKQCKQFENYILSELEENTNTLYKTELLAIQNQLNSIRQHKQLDSISTKEELVSYWPTILMPAPGFVEIKQ